MKLSRKLAPAVALLLVSLFMITTTTLAWFSMNTVVTATGMQVTATAGDNIMVYKTPSQVQGADKDFHNAVVLPHKEVKLAPASSADGKDFYYVDGRNVNGAGNVIRPMEYIAYDAGSSQSVNDFNKNYRTSGSVAYTEYIFQLKATNAQDYTQELVMATLDLTYGGTTYGTQKAFRVAVFADAFPADDNPDDAIYPSVSTETLVSVLAPEDATYRTTREDGTDVIGQTVGMNALDELAMCDVANFGEKASFGEVLPGETVYYRVIVRLWLEGEDTTCGNATFAPLDEAWALDLSVCFATDVIKPVERINDTSIVGKTLLYTDGQNGYTVDTAKGTLIDDVTYYPIKKDGEAIAFGTREGFPVTLFTKETTAITSSTAIYALAYDATYGIYRYPTDVTNQITVIVSPVDLGAAEASIDDVVMIGTPAVGYYKIIGKTLDGMPLYTKAAGPLTSTSEVYILRGDSVTEVTESCILPTAP